MCKIWKRQTCKVGVQLARLERVGRERAVGRPPPVPDADRLVGEGPAQGHQHLTLAGEGGLLHPLLPHLHVVNC
jgi:hypothetical protein